VAFAGKLFNAAFAREASGGILEGQKRQLDLLREKLQEIATTERQMALQQLAGQQADAREVYSQSQQNFRTKLNELGATHRTELTQAGTDLRDQRGIDARRDEAAAAQGINPLGLSSTEVLERLASANRARISAETLEEELAAQQALLQWSIEFQEKSGMAIGPEVLEDPKAFQEFQVRYSAFQAEQEVAEASPVELPLGVIDQLTELGPAAAEQIDGFIRSVQSQGATIDPPTLFYLSVAKAKALSPARVLEGFEKAAATVRAATDTIIGSVFPDRNLPGEMALLGDDDIKARYEQVVEMVRQQYADPAFNSMLKLSTGFSVREVIGATPIDLAYFQRTLEDVNKEQAEGEEFQSRRDILQDTSRPAAAQRSQLQEGITALFQEDLAQIPPGMPPSQQAAVQANLFQQYVDFLEAKAGSTVREPGEEYLTPQDYLDVIQLLQQLIHQLQQQLSAPQPNVQAPAPGGR